MQRFGRQRKCLACQVALIGEALRGVELVVATSDDRTFVIKRTPCQRETPPCLQPPLVDQGVAQPVELLTYQMLTTTASHLAMQLRRLRLGSAIQL